MIKAHRLIPVSLSSFFYQPVFHVLGFALALEVELDIVQGIANLLESGVSIEVRIA
jgi:hypothetical protein